MGEDVTKKQLQEVFFNKNTPISKLQRAAIGARQNPEHVDLNASAKSKAKSRILSLIYIYFPSSTAQDSTC